MNYKGLLAVAFSAAFVLGVLVVDNYTIGGLEIQAGHPTTGSAPASSCSSLGTSCGGFSMTSVNLTTTNYPDELEPANYTTLAVGLTVSGVGQPTSIRIFLNGVLVGTVPGPFEVGVDRVVNLVVPTTVFVTAGKSYSVQAEGLYVTNPNGYWEAATIVAR